MSILFKPPSGARPAITASGTKFWIAPKKRRYESKDGWWNGHRTSAGAKYQAYDAECNVCSKPITWTFYVCSTCEAFFGKKQSDPKRPDWLKKRVRKDMRLRKRIERNSPDVDALFSGVLLLSQIEDNVADPRDGDRPIEKSVM